MIKINTTHITEEGLVLKGTEPSSILELSPDAVPVVEALSDIVYDLRACLAGQDMLVTGTAGLKVNTECMRCLDSTETFLKASNICLFFEKVGDREIDITDDIREEILLAIPQNFHCSEDCQGLCPGCGVNLNKEKCNCKLDKDKPPADDADSPWRALDALR